MVIYMKHISLILALTIGLCPALHAAEKKHLNGAAKSPYPSLIVSFYELVKDGYYELKNDGYTQNQIFITDRGMVGRMEHWQNTIKGDFAAFKLGTTEDNAAFYRQAADYATLKGDTEVSQWLNGLLSAELMRAHQSTFLGCAGLLAFIGVPVMGALAFIVKVVQNADLRRYRRLNFDLRWELAGLRREFNGYD